MGLWNFAKSVGAKLFGASEAQAADADTLKKEAEKHGLDMSGVDLKVEGDKVVLSGKAVSTEELEKIMLAVGNTTGIAQVESNVAVTKSSAESRTYEVKKGAFSNLKCNTRRDSGCFHGTDLQAHRRGRAGFHPPAFERGPQRPLDRR